MAVELPYELSLLYFLYCILPLSPLSTLLAHGKLDYSTDWQGLLQISPSDPFRNLLF